MWVWNGTVADEFHTWIWLRVYIYVYCEIQASLPQGKMRYEVVKRNTLLCFLVLTTLFLAWSLFFTGKIEQKLFFFPVNFYVVWHVYKAIAWSFVLLVYLCVCVWRIKREIWRAFSFNSFVYASILDANQYLTCVQKILAAKHFFLPHLSIIFNIMEIEF